VAAAAAPDFRKQASEPNCFFWQTLASITSVMAQGLVISHDVVRAWS